MRKRNIILINGTILTITALITRLISLLFNIYISKVVGSEAIGIFSLIMSVYLFLVTIATSGLNMAITCLVSKNNALDKKDDALKIIKTSLFFSLTLGIVSGLLVLFSSSTITSICFNDVISNKSLTIIAFGLPFIAMSSCLNAYFTSIRKAYLNAISQVLEFFVKLISTFILLNISIKNGTGIESVCVSLILSDVISEIFCCCINFLVFFIITKNSTLITSLKISYKIEIIKIALPVALTSYIRSGLSTFKQLIIPTKLQQSGLSISTAMYQYGLINGMVMPVIIFPIILLNSYSMLLIPEISTYYAQEKFSVMNLVIKKILKITSFFSICISFIFFSFSEELSHLIYSNIECANYFKIFAFIIVFIYIDNVIDNILRGLNRHTCVMICNILDLILTTFLIYFFVPVFGLNGYVFSIIFSEIFNFCLSFWLLKKSQ